MNNKEIITEIIEDLESNNEITWPNYGKINREKLIECWSVYRDIPDSQYYGYKAKNGPGEAYKKIFSYTNKTNTKPWRDYVLEQYNYKYCPKCKNILSYDNFNTGSQHVNKKSASCKSCTNTKSSKHYQENKPLYNAKSAKYRASKLQRTPEWSSNEEIKEIYKNCPEGYHVDHVIPLQGELVSGLHVAENLQYLTAHDNLAKSNKFEVT